VIWISIVEEVTDLTGEVIPHYEFERHAGGLFRRGTSVSVSWYLVRSDTGERFPVGTQQGRIDAQADDHGRSYRCTLDSAASRPSLAGSLNGLLKKMGSEGWRVVQVLGPQSSLHADTGLSSFGSVGLLVERA
jgi:hypothetical protein